MGVLELPLLYPILYMEGMVVLVRTNELDSEYQNSIKATWGPQLGRISSMIKIK